MYILAKYYQQVEELSGDETYEELNKYMILLHPNYNEVKWYKSLYSTIKRAGEYDLNEIEYIGITIDELTKIKNIKGIQSQKLMFTLLALAKFYDSIDPENKGWVKLNHCEVFRRANIMKSKEKQCDLLNQLYHDEKVIELADESDNLSIDVSGFINNSSPVVLRVIDFRDLGYVYMQYLGRTFKKCKECKRLYKPRKDNKTLYCKEHRKNRAKKIKICECIDCGEMFKVDASNNSKKRCEKCNIVFRKVSVKNNVKRLRNANKCNQVVE